MASSGELEVVTGDNSSITLGFMRWVRACFLGGVMGVALGAALGSSAALRMTAKIDNGKGRSRSPSGMTTKETTDNGKKQLELDFQKQKGRAGARPFCLLRGRIGCC